MASRIPEEGVFPVREAQPVYVWRGLRESAEEVEKRFLEAHPEVPKESLIIIGWRTTNERRKR